MPDIIDVLRDPYGLHGGTILSGSVNVTADAFWYHPITATTVTSMSIGLSGSPLTSVNFTAGVGIYGNITMVSQSSGIAILYSGSYAYPNNR
jgi:hypothetical protein